MAKRFRDEPLEQSAARQFVESDIEDMDGKPWHYITTPLDFDTALQLKLEIGDAVLGSLLGMVGEDEGVNLAILGDLPGRIIKAGGPKLVSRLFNTTYRVVGGKKRPMRDPTWRTEAYSGGNWDEFYAAVKWVLDVNYGPFLRRLGERFGLEWSGLPTGSTSTDAEA